MQRPSLPTPGSESSVCWLWAGKQGLWVSSGSTPPRYVTLTVSIPLQASVSLSVNTGVAGPGQVGAGAGAGGARRGKTRAAALGGAPPPSPQRAVTAAPRHHVRCPRGRHKRQTVAGLRAQLSHRPAGCPSRCAQLPPRASRLRRGRGRGPRGGWAFRNALASPKGSWALGRGLLGR